MSVLKDILRRATGVDDSDAYIDPDLQVGVTGYMYDSDNALLHLTGQKIINGELREDPVDVPLRHVEGGDSFGRIISTTSNLPTAARTEGQIVESVFNITSDFSATYSTGNHELRRQLYTSQGAVINSHPDHALGYWLVPMRGSTEHRHIAMFIPFGAGGVEAGSGGDFEARRLLRLDGEDEALMVHYETTRGQPYNAIWFSIPETTGNDNWETTLGRADYKIRIYEATAIGPSGPAGTGAHPPFGESELTEALQSKIEDSLDIVESVDGSELRTRNHRGDPVDVDATPTHRQMSTVLQGYVKLLTRDGRFDQVAADGTESAGRIPISTPVVASAEYSTPVDSTATPALAVDANVPVTRTLDALTGADAVGKITSSVVGGKARITFAETGEANITWIEEIQVNSFADAQGAGRTDGEIVINMVRYNSAGVKQKAWPDEHTMADPQSIAFTFPMRIVTGRVPVDAGDYLEFEVSFVGSRSGQNINYQLIAAHDNFDKRITVHFYSSVAGAVASGTHTDGQIGQLAAQKDVQFAAEVQGFEGVTYDRATDKFSGQIDVTAALLNADTEEKRAQFRQALGISSEDVTFIGDSDDLNNLVSQGVYERLTSGALNGEPFVGPYTLYVQAGGSDGQFDLHQTVVNADGIEASRGVIAQASAPTTLASSWHIRDPLLDLNSAPDGPVTVEVSASDAAHWSQGFTSRIPMRLVSGGGGSYLRGDVNAFGFGIIATAATPWEQRAPRSLLDDGPARGFLHMEVSNAALPDFTVPIDFVLRDNPPGGDPEDETFGAQVWWSAQNTFVVRTTSALPTGWISDLQSGAVQVSLRYVDSRNGMVRYVPGSFHSAQTARNKITARAKGGKLEQPSAPETWAVLGNAASSNPVQIPRSVLQNVAQAMGVDEAAVEAIVRRLVGNINLIQGEGTAFPTAPNDLDKFHITTAFNAPDYAVMTVGEWSEHGTTVRGWLRSGQGALDRADVLTDVDGIVAYANDGTDRRLASRRNKSFVIRGGSVRTVPWDVLNVSVGAIAGGTDRAITQTQLSSAYAHYYEMPTLVGGTAWSDGDKVALIPKRSGNDILPQASFLAVIYQYLAEQLRWRSLAGEHTIEEILSLILTEARAGNVNPFSMAKVGVWTGTQAQFDGLSAANRLLYYTFNVVE